MSTNIWKSLNFFIALHPCPLESNFFDGLPYSTSALTSLWNGKNNKYFYESELSKFKLYITFIHSCTHIKHKKYILCANIMRHLKVEGYIAIIQYLSYNAIQISVPTSWYFCALSQDSIDIYISCSVHKYEWHSRLIFLFSYERIFHLDN